MINKPQYNFINLFGNESFLKYLKKNNKIPNDIEAEVKQYWTPTESILSNNFNELESTLSIGADNRVGDILYAKLDEYVYRETISPVVSGEVIKETNGDIIFSNINKTGIDELTGYFIQCVLNQKCSNVNKVKEFGIYIKRPFDKVYVYGLLERFDSDLHKFVNKDNKKNIELYKNVFKDIANALKCMHSLNFYHRDIKPDNIGLIYNQKKKEYDAVLCDFGFVIYIPPNTECISGLGGTPSFIDPYFYITKEFCKKGDYFSFGMMIYQICSVMNNTDMNTYILTLIYPYTIEDLNKIIKNDENFDQLQNIANDRLRDKEKEKTLLNRFLGNEKEKKKIAIDDTLFIQKTTDRIIPIELLDERQFTRVLKLEEKVPVPTLVVPQPTPVVPQSVAKRKIFTRVTTGGRKSKNKKRRTNKNRRTKKQKQKRVNLIK